MAGSDQPARNGESNMSRHPVILIIAAVILLTACLLTGCYLYSLESHCKPLLGNLLDGVTHYECETP